MKDAANSPTKFGPMALDSPNPYSATIVPSSPGLEVLTSSTQSFRSAINVSTTETVKVYHKSEKEKRREKRVWGKLAHRNSHMHRGGFLEGAQMPPLLTHRITNFQNVDSRTPFRAESDN